MFEGTGTRAFLHNLTWNPEIAKRYMSSLGHQIRNYGSGWNWAWRKSEADPWIPAEPQGLVDFLLDHIADLVIGAGTGIAATFAAGATAATGPGALAVGAGAGAVASGGLEAARQGIGELAGIQQNTDVGQIAAATAGGAIAEPLGAAGGAVIRGAGKVAGKLLGKVGDVLPEVAGKIADISPIGVTSAQVGGRAVTKNLRGMPSGEVLRAGAELTRGGRVP